MSPSQKSNESFEWIFVVIFAILIILGILFSRFGIYFSSLAIIVAGIYLLVIHKKKQPIKFWGIFFISGAALLVFINFARLSSTAISLWLATLLTLLILYSNVYFKNDLWQRGIVALYFTAMGVLVIPSSGLSILHEFFKPSLKLGNVVVALAGILFASVAIYSFIRTLSKIPSKIKSIKNFEKIDNFYLALSLTLIILIFLLGFSATRYIYLEEYPINFTLTGAQGEKWDGVCNSVENYVYTIDKKEIKCLINIPNKENITVGEKDISMGIRGDDGAQKNYNISLYNPEFVEETGKIEITFSPLLDYGEYWIYVDSISQDYKKISMHGKLKLNVLTNKEYNEKIRNRYLAITAIIAAALFSVFSAVNNLKNILIQKND
ncbi:MAG: hypothetical protein ABH849_02235 [Nanoarchaeota archaeon]